MVRWFDGLEGCVESLIDRWFVGSIDRWFDGSLVRWIVGSMVRWFDV